MATRLPEFKNQAEALILFVDSDEQGCAKVTQMMNLVGYQVHQASSGEMALAQLNPSDNHPQGRHETGDSARPRQIHRIYLSHTYPEKFVSC